MPRASLQKGIATQLALAKTLAPRWCKSETSPPGRGQTARPRIVLKLSSCSPLPCKFPVTFAKLFSQISGRIFLATARPARRRAPARVPYSGRSACAGAPHPRVFCRIFSRFFPQIVLAAVSPQTRPSRTGAGTKYADASPAPVLPPSPHHFPKIIFLKNPPSCSPRRVHIAVVNSTNERRLHDGPGVPLTTAMLTPCGNCVPRRTFLTSSIASRMPRQGAGGARRVDCGGSRCQVPADAPNAPARLLSRINTMTAARRRRRSSYRLHGQAAFKASSANWLKFSCNLAGRASMYCATTRLSCSRETPIGSQISLLINRMPEILP
jgi:hypothetical protein